MLQNKGFFLNPPPACRGSRGSRYDYPKKIDQLEKGVRNVNRTKAHYNSLHAPIR